MVEPLLKWAGGKRFLLKHIRKYLPSKYNRYYEPFFGGGALFFSEQPPKAYLSDTNEELINCYIQIANNPDGLIRKLKPMRYDKEEYLKIRKKKSKNDLTRAARFIYLNRCCWNGLYRVNLKGEFNVPFGRYHTPRLIFDKESIYAISKSLKNTKLSVGDFEQTTKGIRKGDFVYFDPPYTVKHNNNNFIKYNEKVFSWGDQERLANYAGKLNVMGIKVMVSNADNDNIADLYPSFNSYKIERKSVISGKTKGRGNVTELLLINY